MTNAHSLLISVLVGGVAALAATGARAQPLQTIDARGAATAQFGGSPEQESVDALTDADSATKFLTYHDKTWVQYAMNQPTVVKQYALTSADDYPGRDPKNWTLQGSKDGAKWETLDLRTNQDFTHRFQREQYGIPNNIAYSYYRLNVTTNHGDVNTQFADWSLTGTPVAPVAPGGAEFPPATWKEHWFEHNQLLKRVYHDRDVAVYFDGDVAGSTTWPFQYIGDVWRYTKKTYGEFGRNPQLYAVLHSGKYSGGHPSGYHDASHDYRNLIDVGPGPWSDENSLAVPTHEVGHIVESDANGTHGSPAFGLWRDSKWMEIYNYDVYLGLGRDEAARAWYDEQINKSDDFPRAGTHWFRDWFYPIYDQHGQTQVLDRYFKLLAGNFRKKPNGVDYDGPMNWGEFVHFWSGAAGVNLKAQATKAFGWSDEWEAQFQQAKLDYPGVTYEN